MSYAVLEEGTYTSDEGAMFKVGSLTASCVVCRVPCIACHDVCHVSCIVCRVSRVMTCVMCRVLCIVFTGETCP